MAMAMAMAMVMATATATGITSDIDQILRRYGTITALLLE